MSLDKSRAEDLTSIPPEHFALYLSNRGWKKLEHDYFGSMQWVHLKSGVDVLLPSSRQVRDYARVVGRLLRALQETEQRPAAVILHELERTGADVLRVRRPTDDPQDTIPLAAGRALIDSALRMVGAAAAAAVEPRAVLPRRRPRQALDYVDRRVRLGHSERGSYVVTVISDVAPLNTPGGMPGLLEYMETPFPRMVTRTLSSSLIASRSVAEALAFGNVEVLDEAVMKGISAELFDSIGSLLAGAPDREGLGVGIDWAPAFPEASHGPTEVWFQRNDQELFVEAATKIRESEPFEGIAITGLVETLTREEHREDGTVIVSCFIDSDPRKLHVPLTRDDYEHAIIAHTHNRVVVFRADVERRGNRYYATKVVNFRVTDD